MAGGMRAKLLDFGIAKLAQETAVERHPERCLARPSTCHRNSVPGLAALMHRRMFMRWGLMLFEALAGRLPFIAGTALEYMGQHAFKEPPALSTLAPQAPSELQALVHRMLHKDRSVRPTMRARFAAR